MTRYGVWQEDHECRLVPLDNLDIVEIPEENLDEAHEFADYDAGDEIIARWGVKDDPRP